MCQYFFINDYNLVLIDTPDEFMNCVKLLAKYCSITSTVKI